MRTEYPAQPAEAMRRHLATPIIQGNRLCRGNQIHGLLRWHAYVTWDGIWLKRSWGGEVENVAVLIAIGVDQKGYREVLGVAEGMKEDVCARTTRRSGSTGRCGGGRMWCGRSRTGGRVLGAHYTTCRYRRSIHCALAEAFTARRTSSQQQQQMAAWRTLRLCSRIWNSWRETSVNAVNFSSVFFAVWGGG
jgi:hypothetical protein